MRHLAQHVPEPPEPLDLISALGAKERGRGWMSSLEDSIAWEMRIHGLNDVERLRLGILQYL